MIKNHWDQRQRLNDVQFEEGAISLRDYFRRNIELVELKSFRLLDHIDRDKVVVPDPCTEEGRLEMEHLIARRSAYIPNDSSGDNAEIPDWHERYLNRGAE